MHIGLVRFGSLALFRERVGPLSSQQDADAYLMASVIGRAVLTLQAGAGIDGLASEMDGQSIFAFSVHQAAGMVAVQGSLPVKDALVALRAHAFALGVDLSDLAESVIARSVRFDGNSGSWLDTPVA